VVGERAGVRMTVAGTGDRKKPEAYLDSAAGFFNSVKIGEAFGPAVSEEPATVTAAELAAAFKGDAKAADAKYKDKWVRVTGPVAAVGGDGQSFELGAGDGRVNVTRAERGRMSVRLKAGMGNVTLTGRCGGLADGRVVVIDAVVGRTPKADDAK
jgi:hypothetical protein